jgi:hypothetical protein
MQMYNILDKLKQLAESDPHYKAAADSATKYAPVIPEGVEGEKCTECGLYESHCECPHEEAKEKAAKAKDKVAESEINSLTRYAGIAKLHTETMSTHVDTIVESINATKAILNEGGYYGAGVTEAGYSAKAARQGKDIGKPGKAFAGIAKDAGERYGSKAAGERVAGAVLAKLRARHESVEEDFANTPGDDEMGRLDTNIAVGETALNEKEHMSKDSFDKFAKKGDTYKTEKGTVEKTATGIKHTAKSEEDDEVEDNDTPKKKGAPKKKESEKTSASLPKFDQVSKLEKNLPKFLQKKDPKHKGKTWGMKDHKKFESVVAESIDFAESLVDEGMEQSYPQWKRACRESYPGCQFEGTADDCKCIHEGNVMEKFASKAQARLMHATAGGADTGVGKDVAKEFIKKSHGQKVGDLPEKVKEDDVEEGNKFSGELAKAKAEHKKEFEVDGKEYQVKEGEEDMEEGNEFSGALAKAKEEGASSFKVGEKTFQVTKEGDGEDLFRIAELAGMKPKKVEESDSEQPISSMSDKELADYIGSTEKEVKADRDAAEEAANEKSEDYAKDSVEEAKEEVCETCDCEPCKCEDDKEEKVEEAAEEPAKEKSAGAGGMFGKGVYESYDVKVEDIINETLSISTSQSTDGGDSITVTATEEDAHQLADILRNAGLGNQSQEPQAVIVTNTGEEVQEDLANAPQEEVADTNELVNNISGGLNGPKKQYNKGYAGDNSAGAGLKGYIAQQTTLSEESLLAQTKNLWKQYNG